MTYDPNEYGRKRDQHRAALFQLGQALATELTRIDVHCSWIAATRAEQDEYDPWMDLERSDGMTLSLTWYQDQRPTVRPRVTQLPGRYHQEIPQIEARFDPAREPAALARDVMRRVVRPWAAELPKIQERQSATVAQWNDGERRAAAIARALGTSLREDARVLLQDGNDVPIGIGDFVTGLDVDVKVSNYRERATFKIEIESDQEFALELARFCHQRLLARIERNGQTLCPGCRTRPADDQGLCSACHYSERRARALAV